MANISKIKLGSTTYSIKDSEARTSIETLETTLASSLVFKGVITSATEITSLTNYKVGWTYKASTTLTITGLGTVENGDMIICIADGASYSSSDWSVIQNNVDTMTGATSSAAGTRGLVPAPASGANGKFLRGDGTWANVSKLETARTIQTNLASTSSASFDGSSNILPGVTGILPIANGGTGNSNGKAAALTTARTIALSNDVTGSASFDGSAGITISTTLASSGVTACTYGPNASKTLTSAATFVVPEITVDAKGRITSAANRTMTQMTLTNSVTSTSTTTAGTPASIKAAYDLANNAYAAVNTLANGTVASANTLSTSHTIDGVSFDGSADIVHYGTCDTAAATAAKVVALDGFVLTVGARIAVRFTYTNTASSPTLNVNGTGAIAITKYGTTALSTYMWYPNAVVEFVYDGTDWIMLGGTLATTSYYGITKLSTSVTSTSSSLAATPYAVKQAYDLANTANGVANSAYDAVTWGAFTDLS